MAPFGLLLSREPTGSTTVTARKTLPSDINKYSPTARLVTRLMERMNSMRETSKANMGKEHLRYESDYSKKVKLGNKLHVGKLLFVDRAPSSPKKSAEKIAVEAHSKLLPKATGPFVDKNVGRDTLRKEYNVLKNTITDGRETSCEKTYNWRYLVTYCALRFGENTWGPQWGKFLKIYMGLCEILIPISHKRNSPRNTLWI